MPLKYMLSDAYNLLIRLKICLNRIKHKNEVEFLSRLNGHQNHICEYGITVNIISQL